jgi:hypothetical protein
VEPELQGAETFGCRRSPSKISAPAPGQTQEPHPLIFY